MSDAPKPFNAAERERFHALLKLAAESPYEGERGNALAAAERLASQHGMTLDEAALSEPPAPKTTEPFMRSTKREREAASAVASVINLMEYSLRADKARRDEALREAQERGLNAAERRRAERSPQTRRQARPSKRNPEAHAEVLLAETSLPLKEIVSLTGLDIYEIVGMKLKMRANA